MKLTPNTETICDDNGFEIMAGYHYEKSDSQIEQGHGSHEVGKRIYTELNAVQLFFGKFTIDILPFLNAEQKTYIINKLTY